MEMKIEKSIINDLKKGYGIDFCEFKYKVPVEQVIQIYNKNKKEIEYYINNAIAFKETIQCYTDPIIQKYRSWMSFKFNLDILREWMESDDFNKQKMALQLMPEYVQKTGDAWLEYRDAKAEAQHKIEEVAGKKGLDFFKKLCKKALNNGL